MIDQFALLGAGIGTDQWLTAAALILATFILEDAATITAGVLAVGGVIPAPVALGAVYIGIIAGDTGLYGIGRAAIASGWAKRFITHRTLVQGRRWLRRRLIAALVGARFTPGMRAPTFLASGFLRISFWRFFTVITSVAAVWTTGIFAIIYFLGPVVAEAIGKDAWIVGLVLVTLSIGIPLYFRRRATRKPAATTTATATATPEAP